MPSSPGYKRDYEQEYQNESRQRRKLRAMRNAARRQLMREGLVHKGDNKHVNHINPLDQGGGNQRSNLNVKSEAENVSYPRTKTGQMKRTSRKK